MSASDISRDMENRLHRWGAWRRRQNSTGTGAGNSVLARLHGEGAAVVRGEAGTKRALESATQARKALIARIQEAQAAGDQDAFDRLRAQVKAMPKTLADMPFAATIHGSGPRHEPDCPDEEITERFYLAQAPHLQQVMRRNYCSRRYGWSQEQHAQAMGIGYSTFKNHLSDIRRRLYRWLWEGERNG
ncbi:MAG: hypothetical protein KDB18_05735 [Salinibacterium sp.]|nr:hypothetical protein [Salinibacterium sp.]